MNLGPGSNHSILVVSSKSETTMELADSTIDATTATTTMTTMNTKKQKKKVRFAPSVIGGEEEETMTKNIVNDNNNNNRSTGNNRRQRSRREYRHREWNPDVLSTTTSTTTSATRMARRGVSRSSSPPYLSSTLSLSSPSNTDNTNKKIKMMNAALPPQRPQRRASCELLDEIDVGDYQSQNHHTHEDDGDDCPSCNNEPAMTYDELSFQSPSTSQKQQQQQKQSHHVTRSGPKLTSSISPTSVVEQLEKAARNHCQHSQVINQKDRPGLDLRSQEKEDEDQSISSSSSSSSNQLELSPQCYHHHGLLHGPERGTAQIIFPLLNEDGSDDDGEEEEDVDTKRRHSPIEARLADRNHLAHNDQRQQHDHASSGRRLQELLADWTRTIESEHDRLVTTAAAVAAAQPSSMDSHRQEKAVGHDRVVKIMKDEEETASINSLEDLELLGESFGELRSEDANVGNLLNSIDLALERLQFHTNDCA